MVLQKNPFYILKVPCNASRRTIISAVDEMSFVLDPDISSKAQNELINPNKRLSSEINWFIDSDEDTIAIIRSCIDSEEAISTDGLSDLSKLNATLYNFSLSDEEDSFEIGYSILDVDEQFSSLDVERITSIINQHRQEAKLGAVQVQDVHIELGKKREEIRQIISEKLSSVDQDAYVEMVTMLAEKCIADDDYTDGVILSDVIDQYEVRMQSELEEKTDEIEKQIERIKRLPNDDVVSRNIDSLISRVKEWDVLAQPLQLKSQASGMPHRISEHLGSELRNLALFLHNEKGLTQEALALVNAMRSVFAELGQLSDLFETDSSTLNDLLQGQKEAEEIVNELKSLEEDSESLKSTPSLTKVDGFVGRVKRLNRRIKAVDLDPETKTKVRENLCYMARSTAIDLHNTSRQTGYALSIAKALNDEFRDIPALRAKLAEDVTALERQLFLSQMNRATTRNSPAPSTPPASNKSNKGCLIGFLVLLGAFFIWIIITATGGGSADTPSASSSKPSPSVSQSSNNSSSSSSSSNSSSSNTSNSEVNFTSSASSGDAVYTDIVSIFPEIGIYTEGSLNYTYFVCRCETSTGSTVWVYMTCAEYKTYFDYSVSTSVSSSSAEEVTLSPASRIHGTAKHAESIMSGLSSDTGAMVIDFSSVS